MAGLEKGMVCVKTKGRKAGRKVTVVEFDKKTGFAIVEGEGVKRKRCNLLHLMPTGERAIAGKHKEKGKAGAKEGKEEKGQAAKDEEKGKKAK